MANKKQNRTLEDAANAEQGISYPRRAPWIAFGYPAPYSVGASSLGFQTVHRTWNETTSISCERFFHDEGFPPVPTTLDHQTAVSGANAIAFSLACETDLLQTIELLMRTNFSPLAADRLPSDPPVIIGGPLTLVDARLVAPLADVVVCGEGEDALPIIAQSLAQNSVKEAFLWQLKDASCGIWIPQFEENPPAVHFVSKEKLPAYAANWSSLAGLKDLFLIEIARGCPRRCAFCLLAGTGRFRPVKKEVVVSHIPSAAKGVGLVGAAVTDHPDLEEIVAEIVSSGRRVSLSSMRADRLTPQLLGRLVEGGLRSLTIAADGSSARIRQEIKKGISEQHLISAVNMAKAAGLKGVKLYSMIGLPGETTQDIEEFAKLLLLLGQSIRLTVAVQAFVPKPNTPLAAAEMMGIKELKSRLIYLKRLVKGQVTIQATSPRWSWIDWKLAHGKQRSVEVAILAQQEGGDYSAWRKSILSIL